MATKRVDYTGTIKIRKGNDHQEPVVVYVLGWHKSFGYWVTQILNTGEILYSKKRDLLEFDFKVFERMYYKWKIDNTEEIKARYQKLLDELK